MGRSILSVKLAIVFAIALVAVLGTVGQARTPQPTVAPAVVPVPASDGGMRTEPAHACAQSAADARLTSRGAVERQGRLRPAASVARLVITHEMLDVLPMWGDSREDCPPRAAGGRAAGVQRARA